mmetsp:Transcript_26846/g.58216  ORF Transcript_26846/g.58216 Transcript_26846/m.58216 type:complete len:237 (-) Transcript_26846:96-806(-)
MSAVGKIRCLNSVIDEVVAQWRGQGLDITTIGADDFMPVLVYILVKARVPHLYSEHAFLTDFIMPSNFEDESDYGQARKRIADLETAMAFITSIDMNVRDEKGILLPVSQLQDRVISVLSEGSRSFLAQFGQPPRTLWIAQVLQCLSNRGPQNYEPLQLEAREVELAGQYKIIASELFAAVGLELKVTQASSDAHPSDAVVEFQRNYPVYVYSRLAATVSSFALEPTPGTARGAGW